MNRHKHICFYIVLILFFILFAFGCSLLPYKPRYGISPFEWSKFNHEQRQSTVKAYFAEDSVIVGRVEIDSSLISFKSFEFILCDNKKCSDLLDNNALEANKYSSRNQFDFGGIKFQEAVGENEIYHAHKIKYFMKQAPKGDYFIKLKHMRVPPFAKPVPTSDTVEFLRVYIPENKMINLGTIKISAVYESSWKLLWSKVLSNIELIRDDRPIKAFNFRLPYAVEVFKDNIIEIDEKALYEKYLILYCAC